MTWDRALALDTFALLGSQINAHWVSFLTSSDFQIKYDLIYLFIYIFFEARSHYIALAVLELTAICLPVCISFLNRNKQRNKETILGRAKEPRNVANNTWSQR